PNRQGLLIVAAFVENPAKGVGDRRVLPLQIAGLARQLVSLVEIIQPLGVEISEVIQRRNKVRLGREKLLISITRFWVILHPVIYERQRHQRRRIVGILRQ